MDRRMTKMLESCLEDGGNVVQQPIILVDDSVHVVTNTTHDSSHSAGEEEVF